MREELTALIVLKLFRLNEKSGNLISFTITDAEFAVSVIPNTATRQDAYPLT
jgi:hypothetical protein